MTIYEDETGPLIAFQPSTNPLTAQHGMLFIEDANPHQQMHWRLSRGERFLIGCRFILSCWWR